MKRTKIIWPVAAAALLGACSPKPGDTVNESALAYLKERENADVAHVVAAMRGTQEAEPTAEETQTRQPEPQQETTTESDPGVIIININDTTEEPIETPTETQTEPPTEPPTQPPRTDYRDGIDWDREAAEFAAFLASGAPSNEPMEPWKINNISADNIAAIRRMFSDVIVVGNSRAQCVVDTGLLTNNEVIYKWACHCDDMMEEFERAAGLYRGKLLIILGVNDMGYYMWEEQRFKNDYCALIDKYREINPGGQIYLQEIMPINPNYYYRWYNHFRMDRYNEMIREIAVEKNCTYVKASLWAVPQFQIDDGSGAHYNLQYHLYWAQAMAIQMRLWEN
ncbi:MAG: hypothetical protein IKN24_07605 [Lachnospiraceae bacterium]|nr:hypothetical protein [Lachnospiraceae bacterium]